MLTLRGTRAALRALELEDLEALYEIENNEALWFVGETLAPYSKFVLKEYLANAHKDIFEMRQLRLAICDVTSGAFLGLIDLFDFDPHNLRAGVGVVIATETEKRKGYASEAIALLKKYAKTHLHMHQLYANIGDENKASIALFEKAGFELVGIKKNGDAGVTSPQVKNHLQTNYYINTYYKCTSREYF